MQIDKQNKMIKPFKIFGQRYLGKEIVEELSAIRATLFPHFSDTDSGFKLYPQWRVNLIRHSALLSFISIFASIIVVRLFFAEQPTQLTINAIINVLISFGLNLFIRKYPRYPYNGHLLVASALMFIVVGSFYTGGINSQFASLLVLLPLITHMLIGRAASWIMLALIIFYVVLLLIFSPHMPTVIDAQYSNYQKFTNGAWLIISSTISCIFGTIFMNINSALAYRLNAQAYTDSLTGVSNRRSILKKVEVSLEKLGRRYQAMSVLLIDVDYFKNINDTYGHDVGDEVLAAIAYALETNIRKHVDFVGRYGGEEFLICFNLQERSIINSKVEQILNSIRALEINVKSSEAVKVTASIGIQTVNSASMLSLNEIINRADKALYKAKHSGRNTAVFSSSEQ